MACGGHRERRYVDVIARWRDDGRITPLSVCWPDGRTFHVERVLGGPAASAFADAESRTLRYRVQVRGRTAHLYLEKRGGADASLRWYVETVPEKPLWSFGEGRDGPRFR